MVQKLLIFLEAQTELFSDIILISFYMGRWHSLYAYLFIHGEYYLRMPFYLLRSFWLSYCRGFQK